MKDYFSLGRKKSCPKSVGNIIMSGVFGILQNRQKWAMLDHPLVYNLPQNYPTEILH